MPKSPMYNRFFKFVSLGHDEAGTASSLSVLPSSKAWEALESLKPSRRRFCCFTAVFLLDSQIGIATLSSPSSENVRHDWIGFALSWRNAQCAASWKYWFFACGKSGLSTERVRLLTAKGVTTSHAVQFIEHFFVLLCGEGTGAPSGRNHSVELLLLCLITRFDALHSLKDLPQSFGLVTALTLQCTTGTP